MNITVKTEEEWNTFLNQTKKCEICHIEWNDCLENHACAGINGLQRGAFVEFIDDSFDPQGCDISKGDKGVVFETYDHYSDGNGPMVRWFNGGACNIYSGMVRIIKL